MKALLCVLSLVLATPVVARDYDLDAERWNGLGYLVTTAAEARVALDTSNTVDLAALAPDDVLILLYPTSALPIDDLLSFVESGGYLIVADDQGSSRALLERVGLTRRDAPAGHMTFWNNQEGFPILRPAGTHFLFYNVTEVVANYPAALAISGGAGTPPAEIHPILSYDGGREHFAVEVELGAGKLLAIADPSVFLNDMLRRFYGDKQFVANALRAYCVREPCAATLGRPGVAFTNHFDAERARLGGLPKEVEARIEQLNAALAMLSSTLAEAPHAVVIGLLLLTALLVYATWVRGRERVGVSGLVASAPPQSSSPTLDEARGLVAQRSEADFSHLALTLGEFVLERARRVDLDGFVRRATPSVPGDSASDTRERDGLRAALLRVQAETASLRSRQPPIWSADRFLRLHEDAQVLLRSLTEAARQRRSLNAARQGAGQDALP